MLGARITLAHKALQWLDADPERLSYLYLYVAVPIMSVVIGCMIYSIMIGKF